MSSILLHLCDKVKLDTPINSSAILSACESLLVDALGVAAYSTTSNRILILSCWKTYLERFSGNRRGCSAQVDIIPLLLDRMDDLDQKVRNYSFEVLCLLDSMESINYVNSGNVFNSNLLKFKQRMRYSASLKFEDNKFQVCMTMLGMGKRLKFSKNPIDLMRMSGQVEIWLPRLFDSVHHKLNLTGKNDSVLLTGRNSLSSLAYWLIWGSAEYCVINRLVTSLGSPFDTLEAIECTIDSYLYLLSGRGDLSAQKDQQRLLFKGLDYLLLFVDLLECQVTNAAFGSCQPIPIPTKESIMFFRDNAPLYEKNWSRIKLKALHCAGIVESHGLVMRLGKDQNLREFKDILPIFRSSFALKDANSLNALASLASLKKHNPMVSQFADACALITTGEYEKSLLQLQSILNDAQFQEMDPYFNREFSSHLIMCYSYLDDWKAISVFMRTSTITAKDSTLETKMLSLWNISGPNYEPFDCRKYISEGGLLHGSRSQLASLKLKELTLTDSVPLPLESLALIEDLLYIGNDTSREVFVKLLVLAQNFCALTHVPAKKKVAPSYRLDRHNISKSTINTWFDLYYLQSKSLSRTSVLAGLDKVSISSLANLARKKGNVKLSRHLVELSTPLEISESCHLSKLLFKE